MKKPKKIDVDSEQFVKEAAELALSAVSIMRCNKCTHPVIQGYCCGFCGTDNPTNRGDDIIYVQL